MINMKICGYLVTILVQIILVSSNLSEAATMTTMNVSSSAILIRVDQSGIGDFRTVQAAIDSVPSNNTREVFIWVKPGVYREKVIVPANKPFITLSGRNASNTIITWNDGGDILRSPTLTVYASDFVGRYLTIQNTFGSSGQAVAVKVEGDRAAFYSCKMMSYQDTLLDDAGSHYYSNCYIEGATDFICGSGSSLFENCHLHSISKNNGSITAQYRSSATENTGYTFKDCKITGIGSAYLGRPWGPYSRVVFASTYMADVIVPLGWDDWGNQTTRRSTVYYGEYDCYGPGANRTERVSWSRSLTKEDVTPFLTKDRIGGEKWLRAPPKKFTKADRHN